MDIVLELNIRLTVVTSGTSYFLMFLFIHLIFFLQSNVYEYLFLNFNEVLLNTCIYPQKIEASKYQNNLIETRYDYLDNFNS